LRLRRAGERLRHTAPAGRRLFVVSYRFSEQNSHYYNELLGYVEAARSLGLSPRAFVPRSVDAASVRSFHAEAVLEPLLGTAPFDPASPFASVSAYISEARDLKSLWAALAPHGPGSDDILLFTAGQPAVIAGIGLWLARRPARRRPSVFFRVVGDEYMDWLSGRSPAGAFFYHLACADLRTRAGQERVFLLGSSPAIVRRVSRAGGRRVFPTAIPKHLAFAPDDASQKPARPTVYIHLNGRSSPFWGRLAEVIRRVRAERSDVDVVVKPSGLPAESLQFITAELASLAEILPANQDTAEYLENFQRCTVVLLPYEAKPYETLCSGVFVEALSCGKPVVVPGGTLMAQELASGRAAGTIFDHATLESVATALQQALEACDDLTVAAAALRARVRADNSSARYLQRMLALIEQKPDMSPRYHVGDDIDFGDVADSRCFMRDGWGLPEDWGVWTVAHRARLSLHVTETRDLVLRALVQPLLTALYPKLVVSVFAAQREVARWIFDAATPDAGSRHWREAHIHGDDIRSAGAVLDITFAIDAPRSPLSEGLADDARTLGLALYRLSLT
jgi:glycosyltransferase involved in cell wall biosynthesis